MAHIEGFEFIVFNRLIADFVCFRVRYFNSYYLELSKICLILRSGRISDAVDLIFYLSYEIQYT